MDSWVLGVELEKNAEHHGRGWDAESTNDTGCRMVVDAMPLTKGFVRWAMEDLRQTDMSRRAGEFSQVSGGEPNDF
ncbi:hypothetical protein U9M48_036298 [Paspalum notatum var. saurae]|uniref:Uncharacterized protein n=1 Tax=Paspalum notatum var. saurae TaxID=547442 RepID=A0AAQ3X8T1_PASNO